MKSALGFEDPLLILGFHHSGTRLLAELLGQAGLFQVGQGKTYEWKYFQDLNDHIWESWWDLESVSIEELQNRHGRIDIPGLKEGLKNNGYKGGPWGFKDPRTCTTLPTWLKAFPKARAVHIVRDPRDVLGTLPEAYSKFTPDRVLPQENLDFWSDLWIKNITMVNEMASKCEAFSEVRYEELCRRPEEELTRVINELGMEQELDISKARTSMVTSREKKFNSWLESGKLTTADIERITELTNAEMLHFGYLENQ